MLVTTTEGDTAMAMIYVDIDDDLTGLTREEAAAHEILLTEDDFEADLSDAYGTVEICGYRYDAARVWREIDPVAFRCAFADYTSDRLLEVDLDDFPSS